MRETKIVPGIQMKAGDSFEYYRIGNSTCFTPYTHIKEIVDDGIIVYNIFNRNHTGLVPKDAMFCVELSEEEYCEKYHNAAKEVYDILSAGEYVGDHGYHEMDNSWIGISCEETYNKLKEMGCHLVGWFYLEQIKHGWFSDCNIGIVAEDSNGERFWCHWDKEFIDDLCKRYEHCTERLKHNDNI